MRRSMALTTGGVAAICLGLGLLVWTERGLVDYRLATQRHGGEIIDADALSGPRAGLTGYLLRVAGALQVTEPPRDHEFGQSADAPTLTRRVEMFQWRQISVAGQISYELNWVDHPIDSSQFAQPRGHTNPGAFAIQSQRFDASNVQIDRFKLSPPLLHALPGSAVLTPNMRTLSANLAATFSRHGDYLVTSAYPDSPRLGDLRIHWERVPLQDFTILARLDGDTLVPSAGSGDGPGFEVQVGRRSVVDIYPDLPIPPGAVGARRALAVVLTLLGALLLGRHRRRRWRDALMPMGAALLLTGALAALIWLGVSGPISLSWAAMALVGAVLIAALIAAPRWQRRRQKKAPPDQA